MKKFLLISTVFIVLVLGMVGQPQNVDQQDIQVEPNTVEIVPPRLTKSEKIAPHYQSSQDPIGEIPVIFEQIVTPEQVQQKEQLPAVETQSPIVAQATSPKTESNMHESINLLAGQGAGQMMSPEEQSEYDMGMYPYTMAPDLQQPKKSVGNPGVSPQLQEPLQNQINVPQQNESPSARRHRSNHVAPESYEPISVNYETPSVVADNPSKQVETPMALSAPSEVKSSLFGRMKNSLSRIPKWLYGLPFALGAYGLMKKSPAVLEASAAPESEKIDVAGHVHDKLQELQDEYLKKQTEAHQQPTTSPEAPQAITQETSGKITPEHVASEPVLEQVAPSEVAPTAVQEITAQDAPLSIEPSSSSVAPVGGMFSSTRKLLSPIRSFDQLPEVVTPTSQSEISTVKTVASGNGVVRKSMSDCYSYFAQRLTSPLGMIALATKIAAIGVQVAPLVYAQRQAQLEHMKDMMLDNAVAQVARTMKPIELPSGMSAVVPLEGGAPSSYVSQLVAGNVSAVAGQLAAQCAALRLR